MPSTNQFVAVACGPEWFAAKVYDADAGKKIIKVEYMYSEDKKHFYFKSEDDISYEGIVWESVSNVLCFLPEPDMVEPSKSRRFKTNSVLSRDFIFSVFPEESIQEASKKFKQFRSEQRKRLCPN